MGTKDYLLIIVLYGSLVLGVVFPKTSGQVSPFIKYLMMCMLFLSFIKISPQDVWAALCSNPVSMALGTVLRLFLAPALAFYMTRMVYPPLAIPMLLLAGTSTGVSAPFFTSLCRGNISFCLVMAFSTNLLVPFSLPFMVKILSQSTFDYDLYSMALFLGLIILAPLAAAFVLRYLIPGILVQVNRLSYPISLVVIAAINFGALGRYVPHLTANPSQIVYSALFAAGLSLALAGLGWITAGRREWQYKLASSGSQVWLNNVLIIALAVHLDKPLAATLGVFYFIPFYGFVVAFSVMADHRNKHQG